MRYSRNRTTISEADNQRLRDCRVCVVGSGGLGCYIQEMLARVGVGTLRIVDGDVFGESNLNRQLYATEATLGMPKVEAAKRQLALVNPETRVEAVHGYLERENAAELLADADAVVDALDSIGARLLLQEAAEEAGIPLVHGAIAGWYGQVTTIFPGDGTLSQIYPEGTGDGLEKTLGNPSFTPALVASIEAAETVKVLLERGELLRGRLLVLDLLHHEYEILTLASP